MTALEQLEFWKVYADNWCEHKPSITVSVGAEEWLEVGDWIYKNFNIASGLSFLPRSEHVYQQAPYQECSKEQYNDLVKTMPTEIDWTELTKYEKDDNTVGSQTLACSGDSCEVVDIT